MDGENISSEASRLAIPKDTSTACVVNDSGARQLKAGSGPQACKVVDTARRLMTLGLSAGEIEELGMDQPALRAICEYARLDGVGSQPAPDAVSATLSTLAEELRKVDLELEMLGMRKRALTSRSKLLQKLAQTLEQRETSPITE